MHRRSFITALLAASALPKVSWADAGAPAFLAAAKERTGDYALFGLDRDGEDVFRIGLPGRGHAAAAHPSLPEAVGFARRPGNFAMVIDCLTGTIRQHLLAPSGRHFYGHGAFLQDGDLLVTTENDIATGHGMLGLWDRRQNYRRVGELPTGGVGPHDILKLTETDVVIANGGIRTHPASGREKLNIDTMAPNLTYLSLETGVQDRIALAPELHKASIRHLAAHNGRVAFAMQWQGALTEAVPLLGLHEKGQDPVLCEAGFTDQLAMKGYAGSVAMSEDLMAITSPRGGRVQLFDHQGQFLRSEKRNDICGAAVASGSMIFTDGLGAVMRLTDQGLARLSKAERAWDNHIVAIG